MAPSALPHPSPYIVEPTSAHTHSLILLHGHGAADPKVPVALGEDMAATMQAAGYTVRWACYRGLGHWYKIPDEMDDIVRFLQTEAGWPVGGA